jgi:monooxygenase
MDKVGAKQVTPKLADEAMKQEPWIGLNSGYVNRTVDRFPKQGSRKPWKLNQNYALDIIALRYGRLGDPELVFQ